MGLLLFNALGMVAEFEADLIRARTREGMKVAKAKGRLREAAGQNCTWSTYTGQAITRWRSCTNCSPSGEPRSIGHSIGTHSRTLPRSRGHASRTENRAAPSYPLPRREVPLEATHHLIRVTHFRESEVAE